MTKLMQILAVAALLAAFMAAAQAAEEKMTLDGQWKAHDMQRPRPPVRDPGAPSEKEFAAPPSDAIVLFDGKDLTMWERKAGAKDDDKTSEPKWKIVNGFAEVTSMSGSIYT
ncbi:MAG: DUF1080 domain-containing protein, partial [Candidatus Sumerlaeota bacterium]|nr:DUF1080 domain-containing protein [Candidatus Sumerlaeota bacterium]